MKKELLACAGVAASVLVFALVGCAEPTTVELNVNVENNENLHNTKLGTSALVKIGNGLWYDSTTRIVYWWNEYLGADAWEVYRCDTTPSPYYAPNGLPYKYNPETNTFEEIEK